MITVINHWKEFKVPLGLVASGLVFALAGWGWMNSTYVLASDFRGYQVQMEQRLLTQQKAQLETEVLKLEVKKEAYPDRFDATSDAHFASSADPFLQLTNSLLRVLT